MNDLTAHSLPTADDLSTRPAVDRARRAEWFSAWTCARYSARRYGLGSAYGVTMWPEPTGPTR